MQARKMFAHPHHTQADTMRGQTAMTPTQEMTSLRIVDIVHDMTADDRVQVLHPTLTIPILKLVSPAFGRYRKLKTLSALSARHLRGLGYPS